MKFRQNPVKKLAAMVAAAGAFITSPFRAGAGLGVPDGEGIKSFERKREFSLQNMKHSMGATHATHQSVSTSKQYKNAKRRRAAHGGKGSIRAHRKGI